MFEQSVVNGRTKQRFTSLLGIGFQLVVVSGAVLFPLIYIDTLPAANLRKVLLAPPPPPPPPAPPPENRPKTPKVVKKFDRCAIGLCAPKVIPKETPVIVDLKPQDDPPNNGPTVVGSVPGLPGGNGPIGNIVSSIPTSVPEPPKPPEPPKAPATPQRVTVGGKVQEAMLKKKVVPVYPRIARDARVSGTVQFMAIIGKDGRIQNLQLVIGHPLLVAAAREAIIQWVYNPTTLNGETVEVVTKIDVNFTLSQ
jgi:protein TonB